MAWEIVGEVETEGDVDATGWVWSIRRSEHEPLRRITVRVSGTASELEDSELPAVTVAARRTRGRSVVEALLVEDDPARTWLCTTEGCSAASA